MPLRHQVFVVEQKVPADLEMDELDAVCLHACVASGDGTVVGTGRLLPEGKIGRMAVTASQRGRGIGAMILNALIKASSDRGDARVCLSAQTHAIAFYERFGFVIRGQEFLEAGIPHRNMCLVHG